MKEINKEIKKTFTEMDLLMRFLYRQFKDLTNTLSKIIEEKKNLNSNLGTPSSDGDLLAKVSSMAERLLGSEKDIETRLNHLFNTSKPPLNDEKKLLYSFNKLREMLTKIINGLPALVNEKGEMNENSLNLLTNFLAAVEKLEKGQEKWVTIPAGKNSSYVLVDSFEKERLENELDELRRKVVSLETAEKNRNEQLKKEEEEEQQLEDELALISRSITFPSELSVEELNNFLTRLQEIKKSLNNKELEKILQETKREIKLELKKRDIKQAITDSLADKWANPKKQTPIKKEELSKPEYRNYSETLDKMKTLKEITVFGIKINKYIAKHRNEVQAINEGLSLAKKAIESKNLGKVVEARQYLLKYRELQLEKRENFSDYDIFLNKTFLNENEESEFHSMNFELLVLEIELKEIKEQEEEKMIAQTIQHPK